MPEEEKRKGIGELYSPDLIYVARDEHRAQLRKLVPAVLRAVQLLEARFPDDRAVQKVAEGIKALEIAKLDTRGEPPSTLTVNEVLRELRDLEEYLRLLLNVASGAQTEPGLLVSGAIKRSRSVSRPGLARALNTFMEANTLNVEDAAKRFKISSKTIRKFLKTHRLKTSLAAELEGGIPAKYFSS